MTTRLKRGAIHESEAYCNSCDTTTRTGEQRADHLDCTAAARRHAEQTGHRVTVYREQAVHITREDS